MYNAAHQELYVLMDSERLEQLKFPKSYCFFNLINYTNKMKPKQLFATHFL